jgi:hypothetical protein
MAAHCREDYIRLRIRVLISTRTRVARITGTEILGSGPSYFYGSDFIRTYANARKVSDRIQWHWDIFESAARTEAQVADPDPPKF